MRRLIAQDEELESDFSILEGLHYRFASFPDEQM